MVGIGIGCCCWDRDIDFVVVGREAGFGFGKVFGLPTRELDPLLLKLLQVLMEKDLPLLQKDLSGA